MKSLENYKVGKLATGRTEDQFRSFLKKRYPNLNDKEIDHLASKHYKKEEEKKNSSGDSSPVSGKASAPSK